MQTSDTITIDAVGDTTGEKYTGSFTVRLFLTPRQKLEISKIRNSIAPGITDSRTSDWQRAEVMAQLMVRVEKAPKWWENSDGGADLVDENVVVDVFNAIVDAEAKARAKIKEAGETAKSKLG